MVEHGAWRHCENLAKGQPASKRVQKRSEIPTEGYASQWRWPTQTQNRYSPYVRHLWVWKRWHCKYAGLSCSTLQTVGQHEHARTAEPSVWWFHHLLQVSKKNHEHPWILEARTENHIVVCHDDYVLFGFICIKSLPYVFLIQCHFDPVPPGLFSGWKNTPKAWVKALTLHSWELGWSLWWKTSWLTWSQLLGV